MRAFPRVSRASSCISRAAEARQINARGNEKSSKSSAAFPGARRAAAVRTYPSSHDNQLPRKVQGERARGQEIHWQQSDL